MTTQEILQTVAAFGGRLWVDGGNLRMRLPENLRPLTEHIRTCKAEIIQTLSREAGRPPETTLAEWGDIFAGWTRANCRWRERSYGSASHLYIDCCEWSHAHGHPLVPDLQAFETILTQLGMDIQDGLVYGLLMREDACLAESITPQDGSRPVPLAAKWLADALRHEERPVVELDREGIAAGHTRRAIFDAAEYLSLDKVRVHGKLCWRLWRAATPRDASAAIRSGRCV